MAPRDPNRPGWQWLDEQRIAAGFATLGDFAKASGLSYTATHSIVRWWAPPGVKALTGIGRALGVAPSVIKKNQPKTPPGLTQWATTLGEAA